MRPLAVVLAILAVGCKLTEVTVPEGEPRVVVQAVLSAGALEQIVIVEHSLTGSVPDTVIDKDVPPGQPRLPILGAIVILMHDGPSACATPVDTLVPSDSSRGVYTTGIAADSSSRYCDLEPGDHVRLRVETPDGTVVTGSTTVPGARHVSIRLSQDSARAPGDTLALDRQRDTLRIAVEPILARALQVELRRQNDPDSVSIFLFTDTLGIAFPGNLINPFEGDSGKPVFEVGTTYVLTVAVTDSNYYDFARSASDPITGRGFLNHLDGGIGVFGSVAPYRYTVRVVR